MRRLILLVDWVVGELVRQLSDLAILTLEYKIPPHD